MQTAMQPLPWHFLLVLHTDPTCPVCLECSIMSYMRMLLNARHLWEAPEKVPADLYVPVVALQGVQRQHIGHLLHAHGVPQILLVGHDQYGCFLQMLVLQ